MRPSAFRVPSCLAAGLLSGVLATPPAGAQTLPAVDGVHVMVSVSADGGQAVVVARYRLRVPGSADTLRLTAIPFFGLRPADVTATLNGSAVPVHGGFEDAGDGPHIMPGAGAVELELRYTVPGAALAGDRDIDLRVPLVLPVAVATESGDDFFRVELSAPPGFTVTESFPSVAAIVSTDPDVHHAMRLPAAPSLLRWRLTTGAARLGFAHTVDMALAAVLAVLGLLGVRALRRPVTDEE
jgi:hypothetical protein